MGRCTYIKMSRNLATPPQLGLIADSFICSRLIAQLFSRLLCYSYDVIIVSFTLQKISQEISFIHHIDVLYTFQNELLTVYMGFKIHISHMLCVKYAAKVEKLELYLYLNGLCGMNPNK